MEFIGNTLGFVGIKHVTTPEEKAFITGHPNAQFTSAADHDVVV